MERLTVEDVRARHPGNLTDIIAYHNGINTCYGKVSDILRGHHPYSSHGYYEVEYLPPIEIDVSKLNVDRLALHNYIKVTLPDGTPIAESGTRDMQIQKKFSKRLNIHFPIIKDTPQGWIDWEHEYKFPVRTAYTNSVYIRLNSGDELVERSPQDNQSRWRPKKRNYKTDVKQYEYLIPHRFVDFQNPPSDFDLTNSNLLLLDTYGNSLRFYDYAGRTFQPVQDKHYYAIELVNYSTLNDGTFAINNFFIKQDKPITVLDLINEGFNILDITNYINKLPSSMIGQSHGILGQYYYSAKCIKEMQENTAKRLQEFDGLNDWMFIGEVCKEFNYLVTPEQIFLANGKINGQFVIGSTLEDTRIKHA